MKNVNDLYGNLADNCLKKLTIILTYDYMIIKYLCTENNILEEESFDPVQEERDEQFEEEVHYEENEDQVSEEDMAMSEETLQVVEPVAYESEPEPEPEPKPAVQEEVDPRQVTFLNILIFHRPGSF